MLKKYEENAYLICKIFGSEPIESGSDSSDSEELAAEEVNLAMLEKAVPRETFEEMKELSKERQELEQEYAKVYNDQQKLEEFHENELYNLEISNKDFHQLFHKLKQAKLQPSELEGCIRRAKELGVFPNTHPTIMALEGKNTLKLQRPFADNENLDYIKL
eukprot:TRINITY_DN3368_c0_g1_i1.p1 TRINITY_DN3368_c0_g1~~TRINITY_DN3368_c0_g1_i1.p1  ORF type:complete len:161 (-),score=69.63 TRINITY_DN3368_c0_g1_i1:126-608(-)